MKTILVLTDFSKKAEHATEYAWHIAKKLKANLLLLNVVSVPDNPQVTKKFTWKLEELFTLEDKSKELLKNTANMLEQNLDGDSPIEFRPSVSYMCKAGDPGRLGADIKDILENKKIWMTIMGTKGDEFISNFIQGTNAYSVINRAICPVLFVSEKVKVQDIARIALIADSEDQIPAQLPLIKALKKTFSAEVLLTDVTGENSKSSTIDEFVEVSLFDMDSNPEYSKKTRIYTRNNDIEDNLQRFSLSNRIDVLVVVHFQQDVFHRIFHSNATKVLTNNNQIALLVFPHKLVQDEYLHQFIEGY